MRNDINRQHVEFTMSNSEGALAKLLNSANPMTLAVAECLAALIDEIKSSSSPPPEVIVSYSSSYYGDKTMAFSRDQLKSWTGEVSASVDCANLTELIPTRAECKD